MKSWFLSDLHIKDINERNGNILLRFLVSLNKDPQNNSLYLLGDIFDFWLSNGKAFSQKFQPIVDEIVKFKLNGGYVIYLEGNHDFHIDVFWTKKFSIPVYEDFKDITVEGLKIRLEHGDFINPNDHKYLNYRKFVRQPWIEPIGHIIPGRFMKKFGEDKSSKSRKQSSQYHSQNQEELRQMIRNYAQSLSQKHDFDILITGHMHVRDDHQFIQNSKPVRSLNLGTWLETPVVLLLENGQFSWISLAV